MRRTAVRHAAWHTAALHEWWWQNSQQTPADSYVDQLPEIIQEEPKGAADAETPQLRMFYDGPKAVWNREDEYEIMADMENSDIEKKLQVPETQFSCDPKDLGADVLGGSAAETAVACEPHLAPRSRSGQLEGDHAPQSSSVASEKATWKARLRSSRKC